MAEISAQSEGFSSFDFENKLIEAVEELRLKRSLEKENEKSIKSLLDIKYELEKIIEEERRKHMQEKETLGQDIAHLKKEIEDKACQVDDEKAGQQQVAKMFRSEVNLLRDELKTVHAEKLNLEKHLKAAQGKLKLHLSFQENVAKRFDELQKEASALSVHQEELVSAQKNLQENVNRAFSLLEKYNLTNSHLMEVISMMAKRNSVLTSEVVSARSKSIYRMATAKIDGLIRFPVFPQEPKQTDMEAKYRSLKEEHKKTVTSLVNASKLLSKQIEVNEELEKRLYSATEKLKDNETELSHVKKQLEIVQEKISQLYEKKEAFTVKNKGSVEMLDSEIPVTSAFLEKSDMTPAPEQKGIVQKGGGDAPGIQDGPVSKHSNGGLTSLTTVSTQECTTDGHLNQEVHAMVRI